MLPSRPPPPRVIVTALARRCGLATEYHAIAHPSLPNYLAMTSGSTHGVASDCSPAECSIGGRSIFSQVTAHRLGWRSYAQSMPAPCDTGSGGLSAARYVPAVYCLAVRSIAAATSAGSGASAAATSTTR